jgi:hypothetical protein
MRTLRRLVPAIAMVSVLAACGGDQGAPADSAPSTSTAATTGEPATSSPPTGSTASPGDATLTPGTALPGESLSADEAAALQQSVDEGHQPWRLDPAMVAEAYVRSSLGWDDVEVAMADPHTVEVTHRADGRIVTLQVRQPVREGTGGIWVVTDGAYVG